MTITFDNDNDVIVYALEKIILYAWRTQQIFAAQWVWWLASIIGLEQGLLVHINNLRQSENPEPLTAYSGRVQPDRVQQISSRKAVSPTPRALTDDRRLNQRNRVNLLPQTKRQLKKARNIKSLQEAGKKR